MMKNTGVYKPKPVPVTLQKSSTDSESDNDSFRTEIRRLDTEKPMATGSGYKVIGPTDAHQ